MPSVSQYSNTWDKTYKGKLVLPEFTWASKKQKKGAELWTEKTNSLSL